MWLYRLASDDYDEPLNQDYISQMSRQNPRPFAAWFTQGDREYIPLNTPEGADQEIQEFVQEHNCQISDYRGGYCQCGKRTFRIAKLIEQARQQDLKAIQQKYQNGELYDIERDITSINATYDDLLNTFTNSSFRVNKTTSGMMVVMSQNPHDIAYMSTNRNWTSCMEIGKGAHHQDVYCEVKEGGLIAYLINAQDREIKNPLARILIRRFDSQDGKSIAIPEKTVYGNPIEGFEQTVKDWIDNKQGSITPGYYKQKGGKWSDTFPRHMLVAPSLRTDQDKQEILKWLRKEVPIINTKWVVRDHLAGTHYQVSGEEIPDRQTFKTKEEAEEYVRQQNRYGLYEEQYLREQTGEPEWLEEDENGKWNLDRFDIETSSIDYSVEMRNQAIETIINAPKGTFPIEIINEIKNILKSELERHIFSSTLTTLKKTLLKKYPEVFTKEDFQDLKQSEFLDYIQKLPDDDLQKEQVRQQYLPMISEYLKNPTKIYSDQLKKAISHHNMAGSVQEIVHGVDSIGLYFGMSLNEKVLEPLEKLFGRDSLGHQQGRPIPEEMVQQLTTFAQQLPSMVFGRDAKLNKKDLSRDLFYIASLFHNSKTDTPTVQKYYLWLVENMWGEVVGKDYSAVNAESMVHILGDLGVNLQTLLPWLNQKLQEEQAKYEQSKNDPDVHSYNKKAYKLNIERFLYLIEIAEKGKPSGKYRTYSTNWLTKIAQAKPMALPYDTPKGEAGIKAIDQIMTQETADMQKQQQPEFLDAGKQGVVNILPNGTILKWTNDPEEAEISKYQMTANLPCIPKVFSVKKIQTGIWSINREYVNLLSEEDTNIYRKVESLYDKLKQKEDRQALLSGKSVSRLSPANQVKEKAEFFSKRPEKFAIDFAKLNQCLIEHGIISFDLHPDNLGRTQDGTLIALDLGTSMFLEE